ncbi:MAG: hypothetical protein D6788_10050 [Planctomycetota bacterium]|nr:MAG: hypothetical protein D6788_10050 [Planctomycetota bacterium]
MGKRKRGPALFEVLGGRPHPATPAPPVSRDRDKPARGEVPSSAWKFGPSRVPEPPGGVTGEGTPSEPAPISTRWIELEGDRIRVSLSSVGAALAVFVLLVGVFGAYELGRRDAVERAFALGYEEGRRYYEAQTVSDIELARRQEPQVEVIQSLLEPAATADAGSEASAASTAENPKPAESRQKWIAGYTYVVAQEFAAGREEDALEAKAFLAQNGVPTALVRYPSGAMQLITTQGYNLSDPAQRALAERLRERVRALGTAYFAQGGGYKLEGYWKTRKGDSW